MILEKALAVQKEELEIAKKRAEILEKQHTLNDNEIITKQKELINDLTKRVKKLQNEIDMMSTQKRSIPSTIQHATNKLKSSQNDIKSQNLRNSRHSTVLKSRPKSDLNMSVFDEDKMPPLDRPGSIMSSGPLQKRDTNLSFIKSSKDKMFSIDNKQGI